MGKVVLFFVDHDTQAFKTLAGAKSNIFTHFTYTSCEDDGVNSSKKGCIGTDVFLDSVAFKVYAELSLLVTFLSHNGYVSSVALSAETYKTRLLVEDSVHFLDRVSSVDRDVLDNGWVDVTASCSHYKAFKRSETHGGVDTYTVLYSTG